MNGVVLLFLFSREMASKFARDRGYEEERFEFPVSENFKCSICLNVLKNPKGCRNNQHYFCFGCIGEHLKNSHTCPECMDELTPAILVQPPRVLLNCISELRIKCSYSNRGCLEYVKLGNLQTHVDQCGFAPANCGNEGCGAEVNECEKVRHETELCKFRKVECYGCGELKKEIQELRKNQEKIKNMEEKQREMDKRVAEVLDSQSRMKEGVKEALRKGVQEALKESLNKIESIFDATQSDSRPTQSAQASKPDVARFPRQFSYRINHDIFVMGYGTVQKFCSKEGKWVDVAPMNVERDSPSAVVSENQVIVSGGTTRVPQSYKREPTDSIEILNLDQCPLRWVMSNVKLPVPLAGHQTFVYKGKLIVVFKQSVTQKNQYRGDVSYVYFKVYEVLLIPPYSARQLESLHPPQSGWRAELVKDKLFIFGVNSPRDVKVYDLDKNECRDMPHLLDPFSLDMAVTTVQWENDVILIGNARVEFSDELNTYRTNVIKYNTITGETGLLRPTKHTSSSCLAIVTDDLIIAMGDQDKSMECYNFHTNTWQALPVMRQSGYLATAVVSPM